MPRSTASRIGADPSSVTKPKANGKSTIEPEVAGAFAPLTREQIRAQTDDGSFNRGQSYARNDRIFDAIRRGATLRANCRGSSGGPYLVEATLAEAGSKHKRNPVAYACDCPRGGLCKHVVALLLRWADAPDAFAVRPPIAELLADRSRDELVALVERMVEQHPDLEGLAELPMPVGDVAAGAVLDEGVLRRQVAAAFADTGHRARANRWGRYDRYDRYDRFGDYDEWGAAAGASDDLQPLIDLGTSYADAGQWRNAVVVFGVVATETLPHLETLWEMDEEGELSEIVVACDAGLAACLDAQAGLAEADRLRLEERATVIRTLFAIWQADVEFGGPDLAQEGPRAIARSATSEERHRVGGWLRGLLGRADAEGDTDLSDNDDDVDGDDDGDGRSWIKRSAIGFLSLLGPDGGLANDALLEAYLSAQLWQEAVDMLVDLGRVDEAIPLAARRLNASALLTRFADRLVATGDPRRLDQAIDLVDARLWEREGVHADEDAGYLVWLERHYAAAGQPAKSLDMAQRRFKLAPTKQTFDAVRAAALLPGQPAPAWIELRPQLMATLRTRGASGEMIQIHLDDGEIGDAVAVLEASDSSVAPAYGSWYGNASLSAQVAAAAERDLPDAAIAIHCRLADRAIDARQRVAYREAAASLSRVKLLLEREQRAGEWSALIDDLRQRHKSLRALREELDALDLR